MRHPGDANCASPELRRDFPCAGSSGILDDVRIASLRLHDFQQFRDTSINFRDSSGAPLRKICLIGPNGTGKSTILRILWTFIRSGGASGLNRTSKTSSLEFESSDQSFVALGNTNLTLPTSARDSQHWETYFKDDETESVRAASSLSRQYPPGTFQLFGTAESDIAVNARSEGSAVNLANVPKTTLNEASALFRKQPRLHDVSPANLVGFWNQLMYKIAERKELLLSSYQAGSEEMSAPEIRRRFDEKHPPILEKIQEQWSLILEPAGLRLDVENAKIPIQLTDNLHAVVVSIHTGRPVPYQSLSSGMRNLIFRLGHIYSLFFGRKIERGFLLFDEPELSLFPDLLYDLLERYLDVISDNTQVFFATHSPIFAAQFKPEERVILSFDEEGFVVAKQGVAPEGDDPNDLLKKDFGVRELYGKKGQSAWDRCRELRNSIAHAGDPKKKLAMLDELDSLVGEFGFVFEAEH